MNVCIKHESREIRQKTLYDEYVKNVKQFKNGKLSINNLTMNNSLCSHDILKSLYDFGLKHSETIFTNPFDLPLKKIVANGVYDLGADVNEAFKNLTDDYKERIKTFGSDGIQRRYSKDNGKVIIKKNNDYDVALLSKGRNSNELSLYEIKKGIETFDSLDLNTVLKLASQSNYFVNKLGNVHIGNTFDDTHVYDMKEYDKHNGGGAFISAIINLLSTRYDNTFHGDLSIKHRCTEALIRETINTLTCYDKNLGIVLYQDLVKYTQHTAGDTLIKINDLLNHYDIDRETLFLEMYNRSSPKTKITIDYARYIIEKGSDVSLTEYFDNKTMKESFLLSGLSAGSFTQDKRWMYAFVNIKNYDSATFRGNFYLCIVNCMMNKMKQNHRNNLEITTEK